jgi:signal transduction histidine kinase
MRIEDMDLSRMVGDLSKRFREEAPDRNLEFSIEPGVTARGDRHLLAIALENLLDNAVKYTAREPRARIAFGRNFEADRAVYFLRDNGVGFNRAHEDQLFAPFGRLHSSREFPGTGVGLSIVARIIAKHGGRIWAEGEEGRGAAFRFTLSDHGLEAT